MKSLHRASGTSFMGACAPPDRTTPYRFWGIVQNIFSRRKNDGAVDQQQAAYPAIKRHEDGSGSSSTVIFRLLGDPSMPLNHVSGNVAMYGYDPIAMLAS